jgi:hypothetical protein
LERASRHPVLAAAAIVAALTLFLTWPQGLYLDTKVAAHNDPYFSTWRLAWIAHALRVDPHHLYDTNIFYPDLNTLAYSDATLLEGAVAAPFIWAGVPPVLLYNLLLLAGIASSGVGMFVLVRYLTKNTGAALVSAAIFTLLPYRVEHFMHLELQWTVWMPLAFWALHRAVAEGSRRLGALVGVLVWLQVLSCVYYGIFLAMMVTLLGILLIAAHPRRAPIALTVLAIGGLIAIALTYPYARPYIDNASRLGPRDLGEVAQYSADPLSYLTAPPQNWLWGGNADRFPGNELRLFPGVVAITLALAAFGHRTRTIVWTYWVLCLIAAELSLGFNGRLYPILYAYLWPLHGLRAPARISVAALCAMTVVAGFGCDYLQRRFRTVRVRAWVSAVAVILVVLECGSGPMQLSDVPARVPEVYQVVGGLGRGVIVELPMPEPARLPGHDPMYAFFSISHWNPLVNGYSGYVSARYLETLDRMLTFPDDASIVHLRDLDVRYILVHESFYEPSEFADLMIEMGRREELVPSGKYHDWIGNVQIFELKR